MDGQKRVNIKPGIRVRIVLKQDQSTGIDRLHLSDADLEFRNDIRSERTDQHFSVLMELHKEKKENGKSTIF